MAPSDCVQECAKRSLSVDSAVIHSAASKQKVKGSVVFPVFQSATFVEREGEWAYMRPADTPNHRVTRCFRLYPVGT